MTVPAGFLSGVIEGFYGRCWSFDTRMAYAEYLVAAGLNTYIYCPKSDPHLRNRWREDWTTEVWGELQNLSAAYKRHGLNWGVGLSPVELYRNYNAPQKNKLKQKVARIAELSAPLLAILFDDMPGDLDALASRQAEIVADICAWVPGVRVLICPTYYSFDPVLEKFFGPKPSNYWPQLGRELPAAVDIFWTGNNVCSTAIESSDIEAIVNQLGRKVTLWDNYPVNDGAARSQFLYTSKLADRSTTLRPLLTGHLCNPMNQGLLSLPALGGLAELYGSGAIDNSFLSYVLGPVTWDRICRDHQVFQQHGLSGLGREKRRQLSLEYENLPGAAALEVAEWLRGGYSFDPACLTV